MTLQREKERIESRKKITKYANEELTPFIDERLKKEVRNNHETDEKCLNLINSIIQHHNKYKDIEPDTDKLANLFNITRTVAFISKDLFKNYDKENKNIWRDLKFFQRFCILQQDRKKVNGIKISPDILLDILENEIIDKLGNIIFIELNSSEEVKQNNREFYKDTYELERIHGFVNYYREKKAIDKILTSINELNNVDPHSKNGQHAILRTFQIIGEWSTQKNLSEQTRSLAPDIDWDLLVSVRNKLCHNEWNFHDESLLEAIEGTDFEKTYKDIQFIKSRFTYIKSEHSKYINKDGKPLINEIQNYFRRKPFISNDIIQKFNNFLNKLHKEKIIETNQLEKANFYLNHYDNKEQNISEFRNIIVNSLKASSNVNKGFLFKEYNNINGVLSNFLKKYSKTKKYKEDNLDNLKKEHLKEIRQFGELLPDESIYYGRGGTDANFNQKALINKSLEYISNINEIINSLNNKEAINLEYPENVIEITGDGINTLLNLIAQKLPMDQKFIQSSNNLKQYFAKKPQRKKIIFPNNSIFNEKDTRKDILYKVSSNSEKVAKLVIDFEKKTSLLEEIEENPILLKAIEYNMSAIYPCLSHINLFKENAKDPEEMKVLRNIITHGCDNLDISNLKNPLEAYIRYINKFIKEKSAELKKYLILDNYDFHWSNYIRERVSNSHNCYEI